MNININKEYINYFIGEIKFLLLDFKDIGVFGGNDGDLDRYENDFLNILEKVMLKIRYFIYKY